MSIYTTITPPRCAKQARRAYTYEPTDYHFQRHTPLDQANVPWADERTQAKFAGPVVLAAVAALVLIQVWVAL